MGRRINHHNIQNQDKTLTKKEHKYHKLIFETLNKKQDKYKKNNSEPQTHFKDEEKKQKEMETKQ